MSTPRFDLVDIIRIISKRRQFIMIVTFICLVLGFLFHVIRPKKYEAKAAFFVSNPIYTDRSSIFAGADSRYTDYFGDEDDIDRVIALTESDTIITQIIENTGLDKAYHLNMDNPYERSKAKKEFGKNLDVKRTEYKLLELSFTDRDPALAAKVANESVKDIEKGYHNFYISRKESIYNSIKNKLVDVDSSISAFTDTLSRLRAESGINDIISPTRQNLVVSTIKGNGKETGRYIEVIQNFEAVKDILVSDRAKYVSLMNQYATGIAPGEVSLLHSITIAKPPVDPAGPNIWIVLTASFFIGLFFSIFYLLLTSYYQEVVIVKQ